MFLCVFCIHHAAIFLCRESEHAIDVSEFFSDDAYNIIGYGKLII